LQIGGTEGRLSLDHDFHDGAERSKVIRMRMMAGARAIQRCHRRLTNGRGLGEVVQLRVSKLFYGGVIRLGKDLLLKVKPLLEGLCENHSRAASTMRKNGAVPDSPCSNEAARHQFHRFLARSSF
jgi:hypothetical protein